MSNQDQNGPSLTDTIKALFSAPVWSAIRAFLLTVSPLLGAFGVVGLTPGKIDSWITYAQQFGTSVLALMTMIGIVVPLVVAVLGMLAATIKNQIKRVRTLANDPQQANAEAAKALIDATKAIAASPVLKQSTDAVNTLVAATIDLPQVQTIVTDQKTADAVPSQSVVSAEQHEVVIK